MAELGSIALYIALALGAYSAVGSLLGRYKGAPELVQSARYAAYLTVLALAVATVTLVVAFVSRDFEIRYVFMHSSRAMAPIYTWVAIYAGNEGSLLFIALVLSIMTSLALVTAPRRLNVLLPHTTAVLMLILTFFLGVIVFMANPFELRPFVPPDGQGINPLLTTQACSSIRPCL